MVRVVGCACGSGMCGRICICGEGVWCVMGW